MPVLSHLHHLFNAEQCQAYIHTLRWKDRPRQCPRSLGQKTQIRLSARSYGSTCVSSRLAFHLVLLHTHSHSQR